MRLHLNLQNNLQILYKRLTEETVTTVIFLRLVFNSSHMKKVIVRTTLFMIIIHTGLFGQNSIRFTFSAVEGSDYFRLDSLRVRNMTQSCDTVLIYPDTVLVINYVGINDSQNSAGGFNMIRNFPNPVTSLSKINLEIPEKDYVNLTLADAAGRILYSASLTLGPGIHRFLFTPPGNGLFIFNASWRGNNCSARILASGVSQGNEFSLKYMCTSGSSNTLKTRRSIAEYLYNPGDELLLTGYGDGLESGFADSPETDQEYIFQFAANIPCPGLDSLLYDGQWYHTIQVFSQCWMKENLNAGIMIPSSQAQTNNGIIEKYCMINNESYCDILGGLYFWNETMQHVLETGGRGICPEGFHVPTDLEWQILEGAVDSELEIGAPGWNASGWRGTDAGGNLKQTGTDLWEPPNTGGTGAAFSVRCIRN